MFRSLLAGLLAAGVVFVAGFPVSTAQEKKDPPKKKERIALAEPKDVAKDPDFAIQGEYGGEGTLGTKEKQKLGAQVVAKGLGEFDIVIFPGGLPGEGAGEWKTRFTATAKTEDGKVTIKGKDISG